MPTCASCFGRVRINIVFANHSDWVEQIELAHKQTHTQVILGHTHLFSTPLFVHVFLLSCHLYSCPCTLNLVHVLLIQSVYFVHCFVTLLTLFFYFWTTLFHFLFQIHRKDQKDRIFELSPLNPSLRPHLYAELIHKTNCRFVSARQPNYNNKPLVPICPRLFL